jgi:hypothetical protein
MRIKCVHKQIWGKTHCLFWVPLTRRPRPGGGEGGLWGRGQGAPPGWGRGQGAPPGRRRGGGGGPTGRQLSPIPPPA